ncbi:hypothetical protein ACFZAM_31305 [Streptomyces sp. NPDC008079]|uniref:hypothetical protein n=1 Tax=Streptomyces sp. NPDC008079 TaxID=3364806 RepID=UPI0036E5DEB5
MVQSFGLELLILADGWAQQQVVPVRSGAEDPPEEVPDLDPADDWDYSEVEWATDASADEWQLMQQQLAANRVTVSDPEPDSPPVIRSVPMADVDFDREWT